MKLLVTGADGQLGKKIQDSQADFPEFDFIFTDVNETDITDQQSVNACMQKHKPDTVLNCAAYTAVDKAESEAQKAEAVNACGPLNLAKACAKIHAELIHVSTDYVFGNSKQNHPFGEDDPISPNSVYGQSKAMGEEALKPFRNVRIVRTAWLYSEHGNNFVKTMLRLGKERPELNVVFDQISAPTYAGDLAQALLHIAQNRPDKDYPCDILHYSNEGVCSWYDFTKDIFEIAGINCKVNPIRSSQYPTPAKRPAYSVFDKAKMKEQFGIEIPYYKDSLRQCMDILTP